MNQRIIDLAKAVFSTFGLSVVRKHRAVVNGVDLEYDLRVVMPDHNPVCFDIGANEGQTIQMLKACYSRPVIHSFEPASAAFAIMARQSYGPHVHLHQLAMGETVGQAEFRNYKRSVLSSFFALNPDSQENMFSDEELVSVETVQVETLDHFCQTHNIEQIDLLKIDTQGYELPVLHGGINLFEKKKIGAVLLELNFATLYEGQSDPTQVIAFLRDHHLRLIDFYEKARAGDKELSWTTALFVRHPS